MDSCSSVIHIIMFQDDLNNKFDKTVLISITLCHKQKYAVNAPVNVADMYIKKKSNIRFVTLLSSMQNLQQQCLQITNVIN